MRRASGGDGGSDRDDSADAHDETASERHVPVGRRGGTADFGRAVAVVTACILGPSASALLAADSIGLYLTAVEFSLLAVAGFGLVAWALLVGTDTDHVDFAAAAVVTPAVLFVLAAVTAPVWVESVRLLYDGQVPAIVASLFLDLGALFGYLAGVGLAGLLAVAVARRTTRAAAERSVVPSPRRQVVVVGAALLLVVVAALAVNHAAASSVTVAAVEPGVERVQDPALAVTLLGPDADVRVTVVAPDGTTVTERVPRFATGVTAASSGPSDTTAAGAAPSDTTAAGAPRSEDARTITLPVWNDQTPPDGVLPAQSGTYRVRVVSLSGVVVDRARYTADTGSRLAVEAVSVSRGEPPADCSVDTVERRAVFVCVVVRNRGEFPTFAAPTLVVPGENQYSGTSFLESGETSGVLFSLSNDTVERVRSRQNGTVTVALWRSGHADERVDTATVELPPASSEEVASRPTAAEATAHGLTTAEIA